MAIVSILPETDKFPNIVALFLTKRVFAVTVLAVKVVTSLAPNTLYTSLKFSFTLVKATYKVSPV